MNKIALKPVLGVRVVTEAGAMLYPPSVVRPGNVGQKAYGLASLPLDWKIPAFFVVSTTGSLAVAKRELLTQTIELELRALGIASDDHVLVRSNGIFETIEKRGGLESQVCLASAVLSTIEELSRKLHDEPEGSIYWVVQTYIHTTLKGHLSNERRLRKEKRDWIVDVEGKGAQGYWTSFGIRPWRDGHHSLPVDFTCSAEPLIPKALRPAAQWADSLSSRVHFEWVWDGAKIHIVQVELARQNRGISPKSALKKLPAPKKPTSLKLFRVAEGNDFHIYRKLKNARMYSEIGYTIVPFYILDDPPTISEILSGRISALLREDLAQLTASTLVIRTDGVSIPDDRRQMLPRSDGVNSPEAAIDWLSTHFSVYIRDNFLDASKLCLISHHFIPSVSSAWSQADVGKRVVRIESLWGIPEGLYWYSHDVQEVDLPNSALKNGRQVFSPTRIWRRPRYKGLFVWANKKGEWITSPIKEGPDWGNSLNNDKWLYEIAWVTRKIAEIENRSVIVMWFIDNSPYVSLDQILPWYHEKCRFGMPRSRLAGRKHLDSEEYTVTCENDWSELQDKIRQGIRIERVRVCPTDSNLIRNRQFATDLASLSRAHDFVIELSGGILSHVYYLLQSSGARVECIDLYGTGDDRHEFNKLVRDKVPELIQKGGENIDVARLSGEALMLSLKRKLIEEAFEVSDASLGDLVGELADVLEVVRAIATSSNVPFEDIEAQRQEKQQARGAFADGLMLIETSIPRSLSTKSDSELFNSQSEIKNISSVKQLPNSSPYKRSDERQVDGGTEFLYTFDTEIEKLDSVNETWSLILPAAEKPVSYSLTVESARSRSVLHTTIRLKSLPTVSEVSPQLDLFSDS